MVPLPVVSLKLRVAAMGMTRFWKAVEAVPGLKVTVPVPEPDVVLVVDPIRMPMFELSLIGVISATRTWKMTCRPGWSILKSMPRTVARKSADRWRERSLGDRWRRGFDCRQELFRF